MTAKENEKYQMLIEKGEALEELLHSAKHSEQEKQVHLMEYLNLLNTERAAEIGVSFTNRLLSRINAAFEAHPTADLAVDQLYTCLLLQQFHSMQFDLWRAHSAIELCRNALEMLEAEGRWSDCLRYCQDTANAYAEIHFWPEALHYAARAHNSMRELVAQDIRVLENGALLDPADTAFSVLTCALHTAEGVTAELQTLLQADLGADGYAEAMAEAQDAKDEEPMCDPVEMEPEYLAIRYDLEEKIDETLDHERGYYGYCQEYWMAKKMILRSEYGIRWKSPAALNPNEDFEG
ncbi:MAG: hypothetical protein MJ071_06310 [Oscillospiraceae bacterium]|nr:hypothetical protein [Oscillospiraceae bacterium]